MIDAIVILCVLAVLAGAAMISESRLPPEETREADACTPRKSRCGDVPTFRINM